MPIPLCPPQDRSTQSRASSRTQVLWLGLWLSIAGCAVDERGLAYLSGGTGAGDAGSGSGGKVVRVEGTGGAAGTAGGAGTAGATAAGGVGGGGAPGRAGGPAAGTGGADGSATGGRSASSGGAVGTGGRGAGGQGGGAGQTATGGQGGVPPSDVCNASTCPDGCCMGAVCRKNRNNQRCGVAGAACAPCPACTECSSQGTCSLDPQASWDVICASATIAPTMPQNTNGVWDTDGVGLGVLPDPFCQLTANDGQDVVSTRTLMNTLTPVWEESIAPAGGRLTEELLLSQQWEVAVLDDDFGVTTDDVACTITPELTAADFVAGTVDLPPTRRCTSVRLRLVCAE